MSEHAEQDLGEDIGELAAVTKRKFSPRIIIIAIVALLAIGAGAYYMLVINNAKAQYFLAEKNNLDNMSELIEQRLGAELAWGDISKEKATSHGLTLSAYVGGYYADDYLADILASSSLQLETATDPKAREASVDLSASILGFQIDGTEIYISTEELIFTLPFLRDYVGIKDKDFKKIDELLGAGSGLEPFGLDSFMDPKAGEIFDFDRIEKEYIEYIYKEIPKSVFKKSSEKIDVYGKNVKANKLEMKLTEKEINKLLVTFLEKLKSDEVIKAQLAQSSAILPGISDPYYAGYQYDAREEFESAIDQVIREIKGSREKFTIHSIIWLSKNDIVKRELTFDDDYAVMTIAGEQMLSGSNVKWDYSIEMDDYYFPEQVKFIGDLENDKDKIQDNIRLIVDGETLLTYTATETHKGEDHEFDRVIRLSDGWEEYIIGWSGDTTYTKNKMSGLHEIYFDMGMDDFNLSLYADVTGEVIKKVEFPDGKINDLGSMTEDELMDFIYYDIEAGLENWIDYDLGELMDEIESGYY